MRLRKILRIATGIGLILLGILGALLPVIPGFVFFIPGLMILAEYSKTAQRLLQWMKDRYADARAAAAGSKHAPASDAAQDPEDHLRQ